MFRRLFFSALVGWVSVSAYGIEDPTRPPAPSSGAIRVSEPAPKLTSILYGEERRLAMINGRFMREGQQIGGIVLEQVAINDVVIRSGGKRMKLSLTGKNIVKEEK